MPEQLDNVRARIQILRRQIHYHNHRYHVLDEAVISDSQYDQLFHELRTLEQKHPQLITSDSPTQRVGGSPAEGFERIPHPVPVLSLANAYSREDLQAWLARISRLDPRVSGTDFVVEPKLDGLTVVLHYQNGVFIRGATRGDGETGEDITTNLRTIRSLPLRIPAAGTDMAIPARLVIRGEAIILTADFERLNQTRKLAGKKTYQNPRNTASGSLRQLDPEITAARPISLLCYAIMDADGDIPATQWQSLQFLRAMGFPVSSESVHLSCLEEVWRTIEDMKQKRTHLAYEVDGMVIKLNDHALGQSLGFSGKDPRGAIAYKFPAQVETTKLQSIEVAVGRTGVITPYAVLQPVEVGGVVVKQATLHNFDFIAEKDIRIGDRVEIKRAGDVIPYVVGPIPAVRSGMEAVYTPPALCPSCDGPLEQVSGEVAVYCVNAACPSQLVRNIEHFASRAAMDIEGLGIKVAELLVQEQLVQDVADLYYIKAEALIGLEGFAEKKAGKLIQAIANTRTRPLARLISALGIRGIGEITAAELAARFNNLDRLQEVTLHELEQVAGIGPNIAAAIVDWFSQSANQALLCKLRAVDVWPVELEQESLNGSQSLRPLNGLTFVISGTLEGMSRKQAQQHIQSLGGKVTSSVSSKTSYLLAGESAGSKLDKAQHLNVPVIDLAALAELIELQS